MTASAQIHEENPTGVQPLSTVLSKTFLEQASRALRTLGFVTDEHDFAPYRETIAFYVKDIEKALHAAGNPVPLEAGKVTNHPDAGYAYFIYDKSKFRNAADVETVVSKWLDDVYAENQDA
jgi:hypothetical protein